MALGERSPRGRWAWRIGRWAVPAAVLAGWQGAAAAGWLSARILPAPAEVAGAGWQLAVDGQLWGHFVVSLGRAAAGVGIGASAGLVAGFLVGRSRVADALLDGCLQMLRTIPHLALIPLVIIWFGVGETTRIFLVALSTFFPVYLNTLHGIRSVDPRLMEMSAVFGLGRSATLRHVVLPGAIPAILVGVRQSLGIAWVSLVVAESIAARSGIGYLATDAREFMRTDIVLLTVVIYAFIGKWADLTVRFLERRLAPWHPWLARA